MGVSLEVDDQSFTDLRDDGGRDRDLHPALPSPPLDLGEREGVLTQVEERLEFGANLPAPRLLDVSIPTPHPIVPVVDLAADRGERGVELDVGVAGSRDRLYIARVERFGEGAH